MKALLALAGLAASAFGCPLLGAEVAAPVTLDAGPHHREVQWVEEGSDETGAAVLISHAYTELGTGLNYRDPESGQWLPSRPEFEQTESGHYIARQTQFQAILAPDLSADDPAVDVLTPEGRRLRSTPRGIALLDTQSGESVMLGEVGSGKPEWVAPGEVIFRDAIPDLGCSIRFRLQRASFEQDVLLEEQIPVELVAALGLDPRSTRIMVLTEFFETEAPVESFNVEGERRLEFGGMRIPPGLAFRLDDDRATATARVQPSWELLSDRVFLVESVDYVALAPLFDALPMPGQGRIETLKSRVRRTASLNPPKRLPKSARADNAEPGRPGLPAAGSDWTGIDTGALRRWNPPVGPRMAQAGGVLIDYALQLATGQSNYVFKGDTTYYIAAGIRLKGVSTFEGGTVIKFAPTNSAKLKVEGPVAWQGAAYRPVILTARDDGSVGDAVQGASTNLSGYYAAIALDIDRSTNTTPAVLEHFRIAHAQIGIAISGQSGHVFGHGQLVNCQRGFSPTNAELSLRNVLLANVLTNFTGSSSTGRCEHLTVNTASWLNYNNACSSLYLTNCLLAGVTNAGTVTASVGGVSLASPSGVFQIMGRGSNYLAVGSLYRNYAGAAAAIHADLKKALATRTTYPPLELTGAFTVDTVLGPQAQRDADALDLGFHPACLDYVINSRTLTNATLLLTNGVVLGIYGNKGLTLRNGAKFVSEGGPGNLNRVVRCNTVQEGLEAWGSAAQSLFESSATTPRPELWARFTEFGVMADTASKRSLLNAGAVLTSAAWSDCVLGGARLELYSNSGTGMHCGLTNNLVLRGSLSWYQQAIPGYYAFTVSLYQNLFQGGSIGFSYYDTSTTWLVKDNAFHGVSLSNSGNPVTNSHNGYISTSALSGGLSNVVVSSFTFTNGPLGNWYQVSTNFIDRGSRTAAAAGLYHFTTQVSQTKDAASQVDIGYHIVAVDAATGLPLDTDGDGLPDYFEDRNGNGSGADDPTSWQAYDSANGLPGGAGPTIFTPLK